MPDCCTRNKKMRLNSIKKIPLLTVMVTITRFLLFKGYIKAKFNKTLNRFWTLETLNMHCVITWGLSSSHSLQSRDSELLQELSAVALLLTQRAEALLGHRDRGLLALWQNSRLRRILTDSLPRFLSLLLHASLLGQQELRSESQS